MLYLQLSSHEDLMASKSVNLACSTGSDKSSCPAETRHPWSVYLSGLNRRSDAQLA